MNGEQNCMRSAFPLFVINRFKPIWKYFYEVRENLLDQELNQSIYYTE